jgi:hypothetical protein
MDSRLRGNTAEFGGKAVRLRPICMTATVGKMAIVIARARNIN